MLIIARLNSRFMGTAVAIKIISCCSGTHRHGGCHGKRIAIVFDQSLKPTK